MRDCEVIRPGGRSNSVATHKSHLAALDGLADCAKVTTAKGLRQELVRFRTPFVEAEVRIDKSCTKPLYFKALTFKRS